MTDEFARIDWLKKRFDLRGRAAPPTAEIIVGIGDDAAVLDFGKRPAVVTVDTHIEGVHFRSDFLSHAEVGARAVLAAVSDVWAMAAAPTAAVVALALPSTLGEESFHELIEGMAEASEQSGARIVGGNLAKAAALSITTTVFGVPCNGAVSRGGAQPGDRLFVTGHVGAAALGLALLRAGKASEEPASRFARRWRRPPNHGAITQVLANAASAAIDLSDGLLQDLEHLCGASGVGAVVHAEALPITDAQRSLCVEIGLDPLALALTGGEDYELLFTVPPKTSFDIPASEIGTIVEGDAVRVLDSAGKTLATDSGGYRHFS